jgi:tetratricopeptide (TPR) repeat protein
VGGIGKSELAAQYAVRQGNKTVVHMTYTPGWDNEEADPIDRSGLRQLLLNIGISNYPLPPKASNSKKQLFDLPGMMTQPYVSERQAYYNQKLQKLRQLCDDSVLIIIDNFNVANDEGLSDLESLGCKTIVTTWYDYSKTQYAQLTVANTVADKEWALELFYKQCPKASHDEDVVREIIQTLEYHTTAVILLGAQMQSDHADAKALLGSLRNSIKNVGETRVSFSKDGNIRRDATSFGYLCSVFDISVLSPAEKDILIKMSFLPAQEISIEMLRMWSPDVDMNAVNQLIHLRWIEENPRNRNIRLIQIIADVVFETVGHNALDAMDFINHINSWYKELSNREQYQYQHLLELVAQHLMRLVNISSDAQKNATLAKMMSCLANSCHEQSQYKNSVSLYQGAIALYRQSVAINPTAYHANLASCCDMLGIILANGVPKADTSTEVEFLFREALDIRRRLAAEDLNTYGADLAFSCDRLGGFIENTVESSNEAESLYREALDINRQLAKDNPKAYISDLAWSCQNLAFYLARTNRLSAAKSLYHEAELLYRKALDIQRREEIEDPVAHDSALAIGCLNLAILLYEMDHLSESVNLYRETIEIYRRLSVINPTTYESYLASAYKNLAIVLTNTGSFKEAVALARDSLKIRRRQADENPSVGIFELADSYATLANILIRINQTEEAEIYCRETQKLCHLYMKKFSS